MIYFTFGYEFEYDEHKSSTLDVMILSKFKVFTKEETRVTHSSLDDTCTCIRLKCNEHRSNVGLKIIKIHCTSIFLL